MYQGLCRRLQHDRLRWYNKGGVIMDICQDTEQTDIIIDHLNDVFKHHVIESTNDIIAILELMKHQILSNVRSGWDEFK